MSEMVTALCDPKSPYLTLNDPNLLVRYRWI